MLTFWKWLELVWFMEKQWNKRCRTVVHHIPETRLRSRDVSLTHSEGRVAHCLKYGHVISKYTIVNPLNLLVPACNLCPSKIRHFVLWLSVCCHTRRGFIQQCTLKYYRVNMISQCIRHSRLSPTICRLIL